MRMTGEHLFVYGTLLLPQVMMQVTGQRYFSLPATLHNYARYGVRGKAYPGIVSEHGANVSGMLCLNIKPGAWQRLDDYEDHFYQRQYVKVETAAGSDYAWAYVVPDTLCACLTNRVWSVEQFSHCHLQGFLHRLDLRHHS